MHCGGASLIATQAAAFSAIFLGSNLSAYSALGGVLVVMLWLNAVSQVLFYGVTIGAWPSLP